MAKNEGAEASSQYLLLTFKPRWSKILLGHRRTACLYGFQNIHVAPTTTDVPSQVLADGLFIWIRILVQQGYCGEDEARRAIGTLKGGMFYESLLNWMKLAILRKSFNRYDLLALRLRRQHQTSADCLAVHQDGTCPTKPNSAPLPDA